MTTEIAAPPTIPYQNPVPGPVPVNPLLRKGRSIGSDLILRVLTSSAAVIVLLMLASLVGVLAFAAVPSIKAFGFKFLVSSEWRPEHQEPKIDANGNAILDDDGETVMQTVPGVFGALPVIYGTAVSSLISLLIAVPLSLGAALYLVRIAPRLMVGPVSFLIEFLAAIPSIAYGIWGLFVLGPFLQHHLEPAAKAVYGAFGSPRMFSWLFNEHLQGHVRPLPLNGSDMLCGSLVLAVMILPIITAISRDILRSVPRAQIEATVALGATWWQSSWEMLRYCRSGLFGAVMLGLARAAGETMAITMVIGNNNQIRASVFAPAETMSSLLANEFAEASSKMHTAALTEVALVLLLMSLLFNVVARYLVVGKGAGAAKAH
jgi:phosphate transport system permease protein